MNCDEIRERLMSEELPLDNKELNAHLRSCPDCRQVSRRLQEMEKDILVLTSPPEPGPEMHRKVFDTVTGRKTRNRWSQLGYPAPASALAVLFVLLAGYTLFQFTGQLDTGKLTTGKKPGKELFIAGRKEVMLFESAYKLPKNPFDTSKKRELFTGTREKKQLFKRKGGKPCLFQRQRG